MALILRLLLCLVLVLNGTGTAWASQAMAVESVAASVAAQRVHVPAVSEYPPCHEQPTHVTIDVDEGDALAVHAGTPPVATGDDGNDCGGADACQCGCAQHHACAVLVAVAFIAPFLPPATSQGTMSTAHAPPSLAHLIRPPIA